MAAKATAVAPQPNATTRASLAIAMAIGRSSYDDWALRYFKIRAKGKRIVPLDTGKRPCQRRLGAVEAKQLATVGRARIFTLKGRQGGITTDQQARSLHACWTDDGVQCITAADTSERSDEIFGITRRAISHFPPELLPARGPAHTREVNFIKKDSRYRVITAGVPEKTGIGTTLTRFHGSEFAHWPEPQAALAAVEPALESPGTTIVLETTAAGFDSDGHNFWRTCEEAGYAKVFIPWWECDPETYALPLEAPDELGSLSDEEIVLQKFQGLSLEQIKWRRAKMKMPGGRNEFLRQYAEDEESCWLSAGASYYDVAMLRIMVQTAPHPLAEHSGGERLIYAKPIAGERCIIGVDTAEGGGGDASAYSVRALNGWRLLETFESRMITPGEFAKLLNDRGRFYSDALLVIEKNLHGITVLRDLRDKHHYPLYALYHREKLDGTVAETNDRIGWATTAESKPLMLAAGQEMFIASAAGLGGKPPAAVAMQAMGVHRNKKGIYDLNGRDLLVAEMLAWLGRSTPMPSSGMYDWMAAMAKKVEDAKKG
jgi:hypothetical protein